MMLRRSFESRHPLCGRQIILRQCRELSRRPDGQYVAIIQDEYVPAEAPHNARVEHREVVLLDEHSARAFARSTHDEWLRAIDGGEGAGQRDDVPTTAGAQAA
jgi:hypothetical protein